MGITVIEEKSLPAPKGRSMPRSIARHILTVLLRGSDHEPEVGTNWLISRRAPSLETVGKRNQVKPTTSAEFPGLNCKHHTRALELIRVIPRLCQIVEKEISTDRAEVMRQRSTQCPVLYNPNELSLWHPTYIKRPLIREPGIYPS